MSVAIAVEPALWRLALLLVAAFAAPALCSDTGKNDEGFFGLDEAGNMAMHAQDGKDVHIRARRLLINDQDALSFERALENCTEALRECTSSCSRPPPPFDVKFHRFVNLTVPAGVSVVAVEVSGAGGGSYLNEAGARGGGDSTCNVAGVVLTAKGGTAATSAMDGADGGASITGSTEVACNAFTSAGAGSLSTVPTYAGGNSGRRGGNGGLAGAHIRVQAGDTIVCSAGNGGASSSFLNAFGIVGIDSGHDGWIRIRW